MFKTFQIASLGKSRKSKLSYYLSYYGKSLWWGPQFSITWLKSQD